MPLSVWALSMKVLLVLATLLVLVSAKGADVPEFVVQIQSIKQFSPKQIKAPAGTKISILIQNLSDAAEEFESYPLNREKHFAPHSEGKLFFGPLEPGRYVFEIENPAKKGDPALGVIEVE
jgi:hypothetical protein